MPCTDYWLLTTSYYHVAMSAIDRLIEANKLFTLDYDPGAVSPVPRLRLAVVSCMDTRLSRRSLGLGAGDAHLIRNAGGIVTDDVIRSLLVSHYLLGTNEFMVINHTDCGLLRSREELDAKIVAKAGLPRPVDFHAFTDVEQNARAQVAKLESLAWIRNEKISVRGFVFDVQTGALKEVG